MGPQSYRTGDSMRRRDSRDLSSSPTSGANTEERPRNHSEEVAICQTGREVSPETNPEGTFILDL